MTSQYLFAAAAAFTAVAAPAAAQSYQQPYQQPYQQSYQQAYPGYAQPGYAQRSHQAVDMQFHCCVILPLVRPASKR